MPHFEENPGDLRNQIESAITKHEKTSTEDGLTGESEVPGLGSGDVEDATIVNESLAPAPEGESSAPAPEPAPAPEGESSVPAPEPAPAPEQKSEAADGLNAPGTWTPAAREHWSKLDPTVQQEIWKREREASRAMTISTNARKFASQFEQVIQPYMGFIAAENSTPMQAVQNLMQTAAALRVGTPQQKVQIAADLIRNFKIDLHALDATLAGQKAEFDPQAVIQSQINQAIAPLRQQLEQANRARAAAIDADVETEFLAMANDPQKYEFFNDVREVMADIIELADRRGENISLTDAYQRAILVHDPVRRVIESRKASAAAKAQHQAAQRAKGAALSVTPSKEAVLAQPSPGSSIRSAIESAIAKTEGR